MRAGNWELRMENGLEQKPHPVATNVVALPDFPIPHSPLPIPVSEGDH